jgi:hypothetical protein
MAGLMACWPNAKIDKRDTTGAWANAIVNLSGDQIRYGIRLLSQLANAFPPSPGEFRQLCVGYRRPEESRPAPRIADDSAKVRAWKATQAAFSTRVCGLSPPGPTPQTDFDVEYVINAVALPTNPTDLQSNVKAWDALKAKFESEWTRRA